MDQTETKPWAHDIGARVTVANSNLIGTVQWRREDQSGKRDYEVQLDDAGTEWIAEQQLVAASAAAPAPAVTGATAEDTPEQ